MRKLALISLCVISWSACAFPVPQVDCPLKMKRPGLKISPDQDLAAFQFLIKDPQLCPDWRLKLQRVLDWITEFNNKTLDPVPEDFIKEGASLLVWAGKALNSKKLCKKDLWGQTEEGLVHVVRALYSVEPRLARVARKAGTIVEWARAVPEVVAKIREDLRASELDEEAAFTDEVCKWLELERERDCHRTDEAIYFPPKPSGTVREQMEQWEKRVQGRLKASVELQAQMSGKKTLLQSLANPLSRGKESFIGSEGAAENAFYDHVAPRLRMCGLEVALLRYGLMNKPILPIFENSRDVLVKGCEPLLCDNPDLLPHPAPAKRHTADRPKAAFCRFMNHYRAMEEDYLQGFKDWAKNPSAKKDFCPAPSGLRRIGTQHKTDDVMDKNH